MRICLLTTETLHHVHYARVLAEAGHELLALMEGRRTLAPYDTTHAFEAEREAFESAHWFGGRAPRMADFVETRLFADVNDGECVRVMAGFGPDLVVTFGTGLLRADVIEAGGDRLVNLHGGDPEHYRGLDTHLWAIWHRDFAALSTCLHRVAPGLDAGDVIACLPIDLRRSMTLAQLRAANTETCLRLTHLALDQLAESGRLAARRQREVGRYYSFMPSSLKDQCVRRLARHAETL